MDRETNSPVLIGGDEVVAEKTFRALSVTGSVSTEFVFDSTSLKGKSVVVFEELYQNNKLIAQHKDMESVDQTIRFLEPVLRTEAKSEEGNKELIVNAKTKILDTISYENLIPEKTYRLVGTLMDRETGKPALVDGHEVTAETSFRPGESSGSVEMEFMLDSRSLKGKTIVVFEELYFGENLIAEHKEIRSAEQSVKFSEPILQTSAAGDDGGKEIIAQPETTIYDKILYEGILPNKTYQLVGTLMDQETGDPLLIKGKKVISEMEFTPKESSGDVTMEFFLDSTGLEGKKLVVFEELYYDGVLIAEHRDIESNEQTIRFVEPVIKTSAKDESGGKEITIDPKTKIIDDVTYENLVPNKPYQLVGTLMDKESGKPLQINGHKVTSKANFIPKESRGSVSVEFVLNSMSLKDKTVVIFEELYHNKALIAEHKDINDANQSLRFKDIPLAVELTKINSETNEALDGAEFVLRDSEGNNIKLALDAAGFFYPDENGEAVIQTKNGKAIIKGIGMQELTIAEIKAPDGFEGYFEPVPLELEYENTIDNPYPVTVFNEPNGSKSGVGAKTGRDGLPTWMLFAGIAAGAAAVVCSRHKKNNKMRNE